MSIKNTDILVIGSGLAGLALALKAAERFHVTVLSKTELPQTNTSMAQGGIAAVTSEEDSFQKHIEDTMAAGDGLCKPEIVRNLVEMGPDCINQLLDWGVEFDRGTTSNGFSLNREGGHLMRRILHIADHTGLDIHKRLLAKAREHKNVELLENQFAIDLILNTHQSPHQFAPRRVLGATVLDEQTRTVYSLAARATVLATGGAGKVYLYTSNWSGATGDGIAMAFRAGARVANLEFMQFHPTCLHHPHARNFLISEAVRGEGGELIDQRGRAFMKEYHQLGSLAPRDIVARSIDREMKLSGEDCVYLDITTQPKSFLENHFPVIYRKCLELGIDMSKDPIPVVPAAHYLCGGILTNQRGQTDIENLYAIGEVGCSGLHGANRLASNSLLECIAMALLCSDSLQKSLESYEIPVVSEDLCEFSSENNEDELIVVSHLWDEIRRLMWNYVGIVRTNRRLTRAQHRLHTILNEFNEFYSHATAHSDVIELRNIALVAELSVRCAMLRKESRGIHYNLDYPEKLANIKDTIIDPASFNW